ncbi:putative lipid-transfer protein dir1 [Phtheirospermum japonicum]|uniref:Putative lipid-transfer protein dir1 n=1 Tax=Phtheirospermum japonicum TaxID=374723 RepID=A0A830BUP1_9LAMI|nr:putative lipid-transfer protein dir1 [Phtheirospermum japonicum]
MVLDGAAALSLCNVTEDGFTACKPSVTLPSPVPPTPGCCDAVSGADLKCLCSYKNSFMLPSLGIDPDLALALPAKCNLPSPTEC